jgi:hypothetical protein
MSLPGAPIERERERDKGTNKNKTKQINIIKNKINKIKKTN